MLAHELLSLCTWLERVYDGELEPTPDGVRHFIDTLGRAAEDVAVLEGQTISPAARAPREFPSGASRFTSATRGLVAVAVSVPGTNVALFPIIARPRPPSLPHGAA